MASFQPSADRVRRSTSDRINERIDEEIADSIRHYRTAIPAAVEARIGELDREWDIERVLELNAALVALTGAVLAGTVHRKWLILPGIVTAFLAQHAIQGWCPPLPLLRRLGIRTRKEIDTERFALLEMPQ